MKRIFRINSGSCGGCDVELELVVAAPNSGLAWATSLADADMVVLTGPITLSCREALFALLNEAGALPIVALGRCALDGHPFGRGGVQEFSTIGAKELVDGCPPEAAAISAVGTRNAE